jgi:DNA-binding response OmpR family regulator
MLLRRDEVGLIERIWYLSWIVGVEDHDSKAEGSGVMPRRLIVVIDDSLEVLETVSRYLKSKGLDVVTSTHGFELAGILARRAPEAVVLDVMMPALAGSTLAQIVRRHAPDTPIVFYSAIPEDKGNDLVSGVPVATFVPKTNGVAALYRGIQALMERLPSVARS